MELQMDINTKVSLSIFEEPQIAKRVDDLLKNMETDFKKRIDEIFSILHLVFLDEGATLSDSTKKTNVVFHQLSYKNIYDIIMKKYFESTEIGAINLAIYSHQYDIYNNILSLLTKEELKKAINGNLMWNTFMSIVQSIPESKDTSQSINTLIFFLHKKKNVIICE